MKSLLFLSIFISSYVYAGLGCIEVQEKLDKRFSIYKVVANYVQNNSVFAKESEVVSGNIYDVFVIQKCANSKDEVKAVRVVFKAVSENVAFNKTKNYFCYARVKKYDEDNKWRHQQTICEEVYNYNPEYYPETSFPYGGSEDPFVSHEGFFIGSALEAYDPEFPPRVTYSYCPERMGHPEFPSSVIGDQEDSSIGYDPNRPFDTASSSYFNFSIEDGIPGPDGPRMNP